MAVAGQWQRFLDGSGPLPNPAASRTFTQRRVDSLGYAGVQISRTEMKLDRLKKKATRDPQPLIGTAEYIAWTIRDGLRKSAHDRWLAELDF